MLSHSTKYNLHPSERDRIHIEFRLRKGKITYFVIQCCTKIDRVWRTIRRFDTAHGYAHEEIYAYSKRRKVRTIILKGDYNMLYTQAYKKVTRNWEKIKENFMLQ